MATEMDGRWLEAFNLASELLEGPEISDQEPPLLISLAEGPPEAVHFLFIIKSGGIDRRGNSCDHGERPTRHPKTRGTGYYSFSCQIEQPLLDREMFIESE
jgi:hypothetical protein